MARRQCAKHAEFCKYWCCQGWHPNQPDNGIIARGHGLTSAQEVAGAGVPVGGQLRGAGAKLHLADASVGIAVPARLPLVTEPVEAEARENQARL